VKTLNPFSGPGSLQAERQRRRREQFKIVVWAVLGANVVLFLGMLIQGCRREPPPTETSGGPGSEVTASDTNGPATAQQKAGGDLPVPPTFEPASTSVPATTNIVATAETNAAPAPTPVTTSQYSVRKNDSFSRIARVNHVSVKALMEANPGVDSTKLKVGQVLQLPVGAEPVTAISGSAPAIAEGVASARPESKTKPPGRYVVKSGDSLTRIARAHGTTVKAIKAANGLTSDRIVIGQALKLPANRTAETAGVRV